MIRSKIIAHRGLSSLAPENTLAAISLAAKAGIEWVEIDAIACGDGTIVMWHDNSVERCSDGIGSMSEHDSQSIQKLDCGSWFSPEYSQERMVTIQQALDHVQQLGLGLNLEFKLYNNDAQTVVAPVLKYLKDHWLDRDKLIISSFDDAALEYCHAHAPEFKLGKLYDKISDNWLDEMKSINAVSCHCNFKHLEEKQVKSIKQQGYAIYCFTANESEQAEELWDWGIDAVFTDYPQRFAKKLDPTAKEKLAKITTLSD